MPHVVRAGFAALKGTRHRARPAVVLDDLGAVGDRTLCLLDERGRVLKTVQNPALLAVVVDETDCPATGETVVADYWGRAVEVELCAPDGRFWWHALTATVGTRVRLVRPRRTAVIWGRPVSIVTTGSIRALEETLDAPVDPARFRSTLVVDTDEPWLEDGWHGGTLTIGDVVLRVRDPIPRCAVIDLDPVTGARGGRLFRCLAGIRPTPEGPLFGVDADVVVPGVVRPGDEVFVTAES